MPPTATARLEASYEATAKAVLSTAYPPHLPWCPSVILRSAWATTCTVEMFIGSSLQCGTKCPLLFCCI